MSHLGAIFAVARPAWGIPLDQQAMKDAFAVCNRFGITGKAKKRDRRPTLDELEALLTMFEDKHHRRPNSLPMHRLVGFACSLDEPAGHFRCYCSLSLSAS